MSTLGDTLSNLLNRNKLELTESENAQILPQSSHSLPSSNPLLTHSLPSSNQGERLKTEVPGESNVNNLNQETQENTSDSSTEPTTLEESGRISLFIETGRIVQDSSGQMGEVISEQSNIRRDESPSFTEKVFSPLRYPERLIVIDDELKLRQYIAEEIGLLDDAQLRQKIAIYQKLGVLVRVCESELHKIGIKRNKKFLEDNDEKSYVKLTESGPDKKELKARTDKISAREKWIKRMTGLGLSVAKAESLWLEKEKGKG